MIEILATTTWSVHWGGINQLGGIDGQLTKCRMAGTVFYVRENMQVDHFRISAGQRQAMKMGRIPARAVNVLELCAPKNVWDTLAKLVHETDTLKRRVRHNRLFTLAWVERAFRQ